MLKAGGIFKGRASAPPPLASSLNVISCSAEDGWPRASDVDCLDPISGFTCVIEYNQEQRLISCRRLKERGSILYIGAVCLTAGGYREFKSDRIGSVIDPQTGEVLGSGDFFDRFIIDETVAPQDTWGLTKSRKVTLVAGLNILAFMADCDGEWHPLETEPVESFVCSLWMRQEWPGEPPLDRIVSHARRLSQTQTPSSKESSIMHVAIHELLCCVELFAI